MIPETVLTFEPDGTAHGLYTEAIPLQSLGRLSIARATSIEFDDYNQCWLVRDNAGQVLFQHPSRQTCLDWERTYFNQKEKV
jgi:hypothetical protein